MSAPHESNARSAASPQDSTHVRWLVLGLACGTSFCLYLHRYSWTFIAPELQSKYGWNELETQTAYICFSWTYGLGQIPSGVIIDRFGPRLFLTAIIAAWSRVIPFQSAGSGLIVGSARAALGATQAGCYPGLALVTARWFPPRYRTTIQGLVATVCGRGGGAVAPILMATLLMATLGLPLQRALWVMTGLGLIFATAFWCLFRDAPECDPRVSAGELQLIQEGRPIAASGDSPPARPPIALALRLPSVWLIAIMQALVAGVDTIYSSLLGQYFASRGVALGKAGLLASVPLFGGMLGGVAAATVSDALQRVVHNRATTRRLVGLVGNLCACGAMLVMVRQSDATAAAIALGVVKFFADMSQPIGWGACTDIGGTRGSATVFSIMNTGGNVGGVLVPLLFGAVLARSAVLAQADGVLHRDFVPTFTLAAGIYVAAGVSWLLIDTTRTLDDVAPPPAVPRVADSKES